MNEVVKGRRLTSVPAVLRQEQRASNNETTKIEIHKRQSEQDVVNVKLIARWFVAAKALIHYDE